MHSDSIEFICATIQKTLMYVCMYDIVCSSHCWPRWGKDIHPGQYFPVVADWSDFWHLEQQSSPKREIPCPGRP